MNRILLTEFAALETHEIRVATRRAGLCLVYEPADTQERYERLLATGPTLVVTTLLGLPGMDFAGLARAAKATDVPVLVVGGDSEEEREALKQVRGLYIQSCRRSRLVWLPTLLERLASKVAERAERIRLGELEDASVQWLRAAEQVREMQKLATVGRLTGSIAHEINNPLESITNLMYLMTSDERLPEHMRGVRRADAGCGTRCGACPGEQLSGRRSKGIA